ncbi:ATPase of the AAA+ superfamily (ISS) [Chlorella sorokiniana]|uniref:ATPase of the AAA+ superfamily (ISS) n=1 Tax=Chlorella sorokiniana TaxID=3076 RepID=A0A2P6TLP2_CHLSO|nr:ATPase of the AAA+ superfamily (ISS) [Chlorella sorokiniana]|eukprot:PRW45202.1 ATPase of the AAA+ superfamily (ISS) [Chlorella sorokiniana]
MALRQISDAICDHLAQPEPARPLVLSLHGPPGVGKSMFHLLAAHALYNRQPDRPGLRCPGLDCAGYKVLYGMDYTADERAAQHSALRAALLDHVRHAPESLLVVEEYDKLDCPMRGFFRQLLENGPVANATLNKAIVVLESNLGYTELHDLLLRAGDRSKIAPEEAQRVLKDMVFSRWLAEGCEERSDTMKMVGMVSFFLPFFPLERRHIRQLFEMRLAERGAELQNGQLGALQWDEAVIDFLTEKVDFEGDFPIEGAKEVATLMTRYASRPLRLWAAAQQQQLAAQQQAAKKGGGSDGGSSSGGVAAAGRLRVADGGMELTVEPAKALS